MTEERLGQWQASCERAMLAGKALMAAVKLFESGGPDAQAAWDSVEKARAAYVAANRREAMKWKGVAGETPEEQPDLPGMEKPGPKAKGADKGPKLLPPRRSGAAEE